MQWTIAKASKVRCNKKKVDFLQSLKLVKASPVGMQATKSMSRNSTASEAGGLFPSLYLVLLETFIHRVLQHENQARMKNCCQVYLMVKAMNQQLYRVPKQVLPQKCSFQQKPVDVVLVKPKWKIAKNPCRCSKILLQ